MIRMPGEKTVQSDFRRAGPIGFQVHTPTGEIDHVELRIQFQRPVIIGLRGVPILVNAMQLAAAEIKICISWILLDPLRHLQNLAVDIAVAVTGQGR